MWDRANCSTLRNLSQMLGVSSKMRTCLLCKEGVCQADASSAKAVRKRLIAEGEDEGQIKAHKAEIDERVRCCRG